jgi:hypothetical protein
MDNDTFKVTKNTRESQKAYNRAFTDALNSGSIVRARLDDVMKEQKLWNDKQEQQYQTIQKKLLDNERTLAKGGIPLVQAKTYAIEMQKLREELKELITEKTTLDSHTAEGQADNAKFNFLVSACVVYKETNQPFFEGYEDYLKRAVEPAAIIGAQKLANMLYGLDDDFEKNLPENKFLHEYKFIDDNLRPINSDGRLVDHEGRLVDEYGRFIDKDGNRVDIDGNPLDDEENYKLEFSPFLDDNGKPIDNDKSNTEESKPKTRGRKKAAESK